MGRSWRAAREPSGEYYIVLKSGAVVLGGHLGSGHTDSASSYDRDAFLEGQGHRFVLEHFPRGVLEEVLDALRDGDNG